MEWVKHRHRKKLLLKQVTGISTGIIRFLKNEGKNPFTLDSKEPDWSKFQDFLKSEVRYTSLIKSFPDEAEILFKAAEENAKWRYKSYQRLAAMEFAKAE